jgi:rubrerythrin
MKALLDQLPQQEAPPYGVLSLAFGSLAQSAVRQQRPNMAKLLSALALSCQIKAVQQAQRETPLQDRSAELARLGAQIKTQLAQAYPPLVEQATALGERGALRAFVWGQKVSLIQNSLLNRYRRQGAALLGDGQGLHVCEACGFVIVREDAPDICPICKAPRQRFVSL